MVLLDFDDVTVDRLLVDWLGCSEEAGVEALLLKEFRVEEDLFKVGPLPLLSDWETSLLLSIILDSVFLRRNSLKKGMLKSEARCMVSRWFLYANLLDRAWPREVKLRQMPLEACDCGRCEGKIACRVRYRERGYRT